ncbi:MAG: carbonic anhydrase [Chloroflexota bacterium]
MSFAEEEIQKLKDGNRRFVENQSTHGAKLDHSHRQSLTTGQSPFAIILGCADSRVPPELIFDQALGQLFVIRVAGNVADTAVTGSIEYAAEHLETPLLVVLGHESCGAVGAAIGTINDPAMAFSPKLTAVIKKIAAGIRPLIQNPPIEDSKLLENQAIQQNAKHTIKQLKENSDTLREREANGQLKIISAQYMLSNGEVLFFE